MMAYEEAVVVGDVVEVCEAELKGRESLSQSAESRKDHSTNDCPINVRPDFHRLHYHKNNYFYQRHIRLYIDEKHTIET
jgi:hypothetical protein